MAIALCNSIHDYFESLSNATATWFNAEAEEIRNFCHYHNHPFRLEQLNQPSSPYMSLPPPPPDRTLRPHMSPSVTSRSPGFPWHLRKLP
ncbi:hypothetical protein DPMN_067638 [Dreissena polymorpha]|uniref:Uncharacterized protein n=1 Tax=Dreissena polymorpha TaxID=45954 RepID=A0A9D4BTQ1_DREPO|nr:hypothetical protein DPMN_067638 [Dreissena polymorpha]